MTDTTLTLDATRDTVESDTVHLFDILKILADNFRLLLLVPIAAALVALAICFWIAPTYTATTRFMPPQQQQQNGASMLLQNLGALGGLAGAASGLKNPVDQYVGFLKSDHVQDALIERFKLAELYDTRFIEDTRKRLASHVVIVGGKEGLISISADSRSPVFSAELANAHVHELGRLLSRLTLTEAQQRRVFFEKQLASAKEKLVGAEQSLKSSGVNSSALKASPAAAVEGLARLRASITAQEVKVSSMRGYLTDSAPDFKQAQIELSALRGQLMRTELESPASAAGDSDYVSRYRNFKYFETLFELYAKQFELARMDESREGNTIQVIDMAKPPERNSSPKKALVFALTWLVAGMVLLVFIFLRQALAGRAENPETAKKWALLRRSWAEAIGRA
jgi:tyrosine-protein kinase Etk/Wzc